jgi:galactokinase/mevalonate kinase-like predicted kinase
MSPSPRPAGHGSAPARAALAGNPSDGYSGAVLAVTVGELGAEAVATPAATSAVDPPSELVSATVARVAQAYGGLTFMDFSASGRYEPLDPALLPPLVVVWSADTGAESGLVHSDLRERYTRGDAAVVKALATAAAAAHDACAALLAGDHDRFRHCVDATFDARGRMMSLDPRHVEMISLARGASAAANYTGSGGAIVAVCRDEAHRQAVAGLLGSAGCDVRILQGGATVPPNPTP